MASDHGTSFINKKKKAVQIGAQAVTPTKTSSLIATDIKTNIQGKSCVVNKNGKGQHINLRGVKSWKIESNSLVIETVDNIIPIILTFISSTEAELGEIRWSLIFNGALLL